MKHMIGLTRKSAFQKMKITVCERFMILRLLNNQLDKRPFVSWARRRKAWIIEQTSSKSVDRWAVSKTENRTAVTRKHEYRNGTVTRIILKKIITWKGQVQHRYDMSTILVHILNKVSILPRLWHTHIRFPKIWNIQLWIHDCSRYIWLSLPEFQSRIIRRLNKFLNPMTILTYRSSQLFGQDVP